MANIKSQKKRILTNEVCRVRNKRVRTSLKTYAKRFHQALDGGDLEAAGTALRTATQALDRAASKGVIHKNNAANRKSELARRMSSALAPPP